MYGIRPGKVMPLDMSMAIRHDIESMEFRHMMEQYGCEPEQDNDEEDEGGDE